MTAFFEGVLQFFSSIFAFLQNIITGTITLLLSLPKALHLLTYSISMLPPEVAVIGTALIAVSVTYLILGR